MKRIMVLSTLGMMLALAVANFPEARDLDGHEETLDRAQASWNALVQYMSALSQPGLFVAAPGTTTVADVWPHSQIMHAALDLSMLTGDQSSFDQTVQALAAYKLANAYTAYAPTVHPSPGQSRFWDDNGVTGLALIQAVYQTANPQQYLDMVTEMWPFILTGQASDGGVYWHEGDPQPKRGLSATGSTTELALRLHLATGRADRASPYLTFALLNDQWLNAHLRAPQGFYWNSWYDNPADNPCDPDPSMPPNLCPWMFTYNQGMAIGSDVLFYRITGQRQYLTRAIQTANAALDFFTPDLLWTQAAPFNAIFFRNLLVLDHFAHDPRYRRTLKQYLDRAWREAREPSTGLFRLGGIGVYGGTFGSIDQAAFVQMFTLLGWPRERLQDLT
jgi:hypothetical protein